MKGIQRWIFPLLLFITHMFPEGICESIPSVSVLVNQQAVLVINASSCKTFKFRKIFPTEANIAKCQNYQCTIDKGFLEKFAFEDTRKNLVLTSAKYSDRGTYEYICNGNKDSVILDVLAAVNVTASESGSITLQCYAEAAEDVSWFHNDTKILQRKINRSTSILDPDFESRVSLEDGCFKDGDLSLTISNVSKRDAGLYRCFVGDDAAKGDPHAHVLHVNEKRFGPGEVKESSSSEASTLKTIIFVFTFTFVVFILIVVVLLVKIYKPDCINTTLFKGRSQSTSTTASQTAESENSAPETVKMLTQVSTPPLNNDSQSVETVTQPVQESEGTAKPSSTQPF